MSMELNITDIKQIKVTRATRFFADKNKEYYGCLASFIDEKGKAVDVMFTSANKELMKKIEVLNGR